MEVKYKMKIYTLTGCSGIGKDSILNELTKLKKDLIPVISATSRPMRLGETQDKEYHFVSDKKAKEMLINDEFIESRTYQVANNDLWIYGITKNSIDFDSNKNYIVIVDFNGLCELNKYLYNKGYDNAISIYIDGSYQARLLRSLQREGKMQDEQIEEVLRRFKDDNRQVLPAKDYCNYVISNEGNFENTINRVLDILESEE